MCIMELVDYNEAMLGGGEAAKTKSVRRRRTSKKNGNQPKAHEKSFIIMKFSMHTKKKLTKITLF